MSRILLVDDHALVRRGVRLILEQEPDLSVVGEAGDGAEALALLRTLEVDLVVLDIAMPRMTGLQAAAELQRRRPELKILILSVHDNEQYLFEALRVGASGYVLKTAADRDCLLALAAEPALLPQLRQHLAHQTQANQGGKSRHQTADSCADIPPLQILPHPC